MQKLDPSLPIPPRHYKPHGLIINENVKQSLRQITEAMNDCLDLIDAVKKL
jgi:hypothetical protein